MNADNIQAKYMTALSAITADGGWVEWPAVRLALHLAVQDAAALAQPAPQPIDQRSAEVVADQVNRLNEWLADEEEVLYRDPNLDTAAAILKAIRCRDHDLVMARHDLQAAIAERDQLRQQLAQLDADNAGLIAEIDRLTRLNGIATDTFNSLAHTNGVDPTPAAQLVEVSDWGRSHQAWSGLPKADLDVIDQLNSGLTTFRRLSATLRRDLAGRVIRHLATDGYLRQHDYETQKPGWMATATAIARLAPDYQWQTLLAEVMAA